MLGLGLKWCKGNTRLKPGLGLGLEEGKDEEGRRQYGGELRAMGATGVPTGFGKKMKGGRVNGAGWRVAPGEGGGSEGGVVRVGCRVTVKVRDVRDLGIGYFTVPS